MTYLKRSQTFVRIWENSFPPFLFFKDFRMPQTTLMRYTKSEETDIYSRV